MAETLKSVEQIHDERGPTDATATFDRLWGILGDIKGKVDGRFTTELDPSCADLEDYGGETGPRGTLRTYVGDEIDWLVHSWLGDPQTGFTNMHLTAWLGPQVNVPHLGMAWGTLPDLWCYIDLQPRADLATDLEYLDRYYEPFNQRFLDVRARPDVSAFVSQELYVRVSVTDTACCFVTETGGRTTRSHRVPRPRDGRRVVGSRRRRPAGPGRRPRRAGRAGPGDSAQRGRARPGQRHGGEVLRRGTDGSPDPDAVGRGPPTGPSRSVTREDP